MYMDSMKYTEKHEPEHVYIFAGSCIFCGKKQKITVKGKELFRFRRGEYIQNALSNNEDEREFLISGTCGSCFDNTFDDFEKNDAEA